MSGGSYEYLYSKELDDFFSWSAVDNLEKMIDRLAGLGYAGDAAKESMDFLIELRRCRTRLETRLEQISPIWKAIEWWDSADWSEDQVKRALAQWRGQEGESPTGSGGQA